jgi:hypothetical protein
MGIVSCRTCLYMYREMAHTDQGKAKIEHNRRLQVIAGRLQERLIHDQVAGKTEPEQGLACGKGTRQKGADGIRN